MKIQSVFALPICVTSYEPFWVASFWSLTSKLSPIDQVVISSIYKTLIGSKVIVAETVVLPESNVPPKSSVVAAKADGRTIKPCTNPST